MLGKMLAKMCLSPTTFAFFTLVITIVVSQFTQLEENRKGTELILDISDEHKAQYLNQDFYSNAYNYGYEVNPNGQFHHEVHGPDDITYGCYGYVDPFGKLKTTFYISDGWGYRVVHPGQNVELFFHEHERHENSQSHEHDNDDHHDHHGILRAWDKLHFPSICAQFEGTNTNPTVIPPSKPETLGAPGIPGIPKYPATPGTPETPPRSGYLRKSETPTIPGRSESSTSSRTPNLPGRPGTPRTQETPSYTEYFEKPGTPEIPRPSNIPGKPKTPDIPDTPSHPEFPRKPARVRMSSTPSTPEKQYYPEYPSTSGTSVTPGKAFQPSHPDISITPVIPEKPSHPMQSDTPSILSRPKTPETFVTPGTSGTPYYPSYHERSRTSDIPGIIRTPLRLTYPDTSITFGTPDKQDTLGPNSFGIQFRNPGTPETPGSPGTPETPGTLPQPIYLNTTRTSNNPDDKDSPSSPSTSTASEVSNILGVVDNSGVEELPASQQLDAPGTSSQLVSSGIMLHPTVPLSSAYLDAGVVFNTQESPTRTQPPTHLGSAPPAHLVSLPPIHLVSLPPVHLDPPSPAYLSTTRTPSHPEYLGISSTPGIVEIPTRTQPPTHLCSPSLAHLGSLPPAHLGSLPPSHLGSLPPANLGPLPSAHLDTLGTPSPRVNSDISRKEPQSPYPGTSETYKFPDSPRPPSQYIIPGTSDTLDTSGHQNDTSETQPYPVYSETPETYNTSSRQDIPGNHGTSETHPEYHDTSDIPSRQDTSEYDDNSDTSRILTYSRYPVIPRPTISPDRQRPLERDRTRTSLSRVDNSGYRRKSGGKQHAEYSDTSERSNRPNIPSYPPYPLHLSYNGSLRYPSAYPRILGTNGRPGLFGKPNYPIHVRYPSYFNGPEGPVGPKGPIDDIGDIGDVGGDGEAGPDGPWPTGSPGPDGPWPGDPDYYSSVIHSAKSRSRGPVKILRLKSYTPINISSSIKTDFPGQINLKSLIKSNIASAINNDKLSEVSYPIKVSKIVDLDHSKIKTQEYEQIDEGNVNHNAKEINSLMHDTLKTSDHLKDTFSKNLEKDEITDKNIKTYGLKIERKQNNQYEVIEDIKRAEEPKEDLEEFPVHRQKQYRKEYKFSANHTFASQDIIKDALEQPYEINHQGSRLIVHTKFDRNEENKRRENIDSPENETIAIMEQVNISSEGEQRDHRINATGVQPPHLVNIKSFSLPLGPNPQACPCYLVESHKENDITRSTTSTPPLIGQLGFIPVIFIPYCPGNKADSHKMKLMYPSATPIPYPCNACTTSGENIETKLLGLQLDQLGNIENLKGVLSVANLGFLNVPIRNVVEKRKIRNRKVV